MTNETIYRFGTVLGTMAIVVRKCAVCGVTLPSGTEEGLGARLRERWPSAQEQVPFGFAADVIASIHALFEGEADRVSMIPVDLLDVPEFNRRVYRETVGIPAGTTRTYGDIARSLGDIGLSRAVGRALGENPVPLLIPCHRVLGTDGRAGGFSAPGGIDTKLRLLNIERAFAATGDGLFGPQALPLAVRPSRN